MTVPTTITAKLSELEQLCERYPSKIPIEECAAFLGMAGESLRACLEHGSCPFGLGWLKKNAHNRAFLHSDIDLLSLGDAIRRFKNNKI